MPTSKRWKQCPDCKRIKTAAEWEEDDKEGGWVHFCWKCWDKHSHEDGLPEIGYITEPLLLEALLATRS